MSPVTQTARIQIRRGLLAALPQLAIGEFGWATDTQQLFIGNGIDNTLITGSGGSGGGGNGLPVISASLIDNNSIGNLVVGVSGPASNVGGLISYTINRANIGRVGVFSYALSGANVIVWDDEYEGANVGIALSAVFTTSSNSAIGLYYTSTATTYNAILNATINTF